jgi:hypothetical protein
MATIPRFPEIFLREHATWHRDMRMGMGMRSGDGAAFLEFHRTFMQKCLEWYRTKGLDAKLVQPWSSIPPEIKRHPRWNRRLQDAENRITTNLSSFNSHDELGQFVQSSTLHDSIHVIGATVFNDGNFGLLPLAPRSTLFYNWHGMIDNWWKQLGK